MSPEPFGSDGGERAARPRGAGDGGRRRRRRALRAALLGLALVLLVAGGGLTALYVKLDGNISGVDIDTALGRDRPADSPNGSTDLLVLGSDSRAGANGAYGGSEPGARADTAMVVHIAENGEAASVVSIPRDTIVDRPACERPGGGTAPARTRSMFNDAYAVGGPVCAVKTVEELTGLRMDHYLEIDFSGFAKLVDTLGGVEITTTEAIDDRDSRLSLPAGTHTLDGDQALALVRTRKAVGDGSDLSRIELQHSFLRALAEQVGDAGLLTDPKRLYDFADAATSSVTTDSSLASVADLTGLARTLRGIDPDRLQTLTLPVTQDPADPNRVLPLESASRAVWDALRADRPVPDSALRGSTAGGHRGDGLIAGE
ncbi:LCP family protein [Streptomyces sp. RFCAC02]|uniref:LCP family protein n=1 Tax=Streptomyces sp. RFCAC02 TaxID=2499143 RepID=UPI00102131B6|nr:LCP family protein [Streptomyces sp. RFCAC02]